MSSTNENLFDLVKSNQLEHLKNILHKPHYILDNYDRNLLQIACHDGLYFVAEFLLSIGYDANIIVLSNENNTLLHECIRYGHIEIIKLLSSYNIDLLARNSVGSNALHFAAYYDKLEILDYFINKQIFDIYDVDKDGNNILHLACLNGNFSIVEYLIHSKYNLNKVNNFNRSALHNSVIKGDIKIVEILIHIVIQIGIKDSSHGRLALHYTCQYNQLDILKYFIDNNIYNIYCKDDKGYTILHIACIYDNIDILKYLISIGIDNNIISRDLKGRSILHITSLYDKLDIMKYLISCNKYDIYDIDMYNENILFLACTNNHYDIVEYLLSISYDINKCSSDNISVIHLLIQLGNLFILKLLLNANIDINIKTISQNQSALHFTIIFNQLNILKYFIDNNIYKNIYDSDNNGHNILHLACHYNNYNIVNYLLSIGYDVNKTNTSNNQSALFYGINSNNVDIVKALLDNNIDINIKESTCYRTAIHQASINGDESIEIFKYLINSNYNLYDVDYDGNSILHLAYNNCNILIVMYLLSIGYNIILINDNNKTAYDISIEYYYYDLIDLLNNHQVHF